MRMIEMTITIHFVFCTIFELLSLVSLAKWVSVLLLRFYKMADMVKIRRHTGHSVLLLSCARSLARSLTRTGSMLTHEYHF